MISLVIIHVVLLSLSVLLTTGSTITAAAGFAVPKQFIILNLIATVTGVGCGIALLFITTLDIRCLALFGYIVLFGFTHAYIARRNQALATSFGS